MEFLWAEILSCFLAVFAAVTNGLVSYVIIRRPQLHNTANWFILSLAVADFCFALVSIPHAFLCSPKMNVFCPDTALFHVYWFFVAASITNLCCLGTDRLISVQCSLRYSDLMTTKRVVALISTAWVMPLIVVSISLPAKLSFNEERRKEFYRVFSLIYTIVLVVVPSIYLLLVTGHMIYTARKLSRQRMVIVAQLNFNRPQDSTAVITANREAKIRASTFVVGTVVSCFLVCYSVATYRIVCSIVSSSCLVPRPLYDLPRLLYLLNSALNPIVYSLFKRDIKTELKRLFCDSSVLPQ